MNIENEGFNRFPDRYINAIDNDPEDNYFTPVMLDILNAIPEPKTVCDVGCGNGVFSIALKRHTRCRLVGVDGSEHAVTKAYEIGFDEVHWVRDLCSDHLPIADGSMDLVVCKDVLEHLLEPQHLVAEISRVTKLGGHCLMHVPNHFPIIGRIRLLIYNKIDTFNYFPDSNRWDFPHIRFFDKESLIRVAAIHGLYPELDLSWHFFRPTKLGRVFPWLARMFGNRFSDATSEGITVLFRNGDNSNSKGW